MRLDDDLISQIYTVESRLDNLRNEPSFVFAP